MRYAVILAGGSGSLFWPLSTKQHPKQCLSILSEKPVIQDTAERLYPLFPQEQILIVTNKELQQHIQLVLPKLQYIIEPCARDTMGAIALACLMLVKKDPEAVLFVETSDHYYEDLKKYHQAIEDALALAEKGKIVTIGITPTSPATRFGYIKVGEKIGKGYQVAQFREKPNKETAERFLDEGGYFWNSGMYVFQAKTMLQELERYQPAFFAQLQAIMDGEALEKHFCQLPKISVDYAISEHSKELCCVTVDMPWDDLGKLDILEKVHQANREGNVVVGRHVGIESTGNIVYGKNGKLIATLGVKDLIIVQTNTVTFLCPKDRAEDVKKLVQKLEREGMAEYL